MSLRRVNKSVGAEDLVYLYPSGPHRGTFDEDQSPACGDRLRKPKSESGLILNRQSVPGAAHNKNLTTRPKGAST